MVPLAPRYDWRILDLVELLDDRREPLAEINRRVGAAAAALGLIRPSYSHLRRVIHELRQLADEDRARKEAVRQVLVDVAAGFAGARRVNPYEAEARAVAKLEERAKQRLVAQSHKPGSAASVPRPRPRPRPRAP